MNNIMKKINIIVVILCMLIFTSCSSNNIISSSEENHIADNAISSSGENYIADNIFSSSNENIIADTVVLGTIYTAESDNNSMASAFAIKDGKYIYVGDEEGVSQYIKEGVTNVINNTEKGLVIPGCTEGHGHFVGLDGLSRLLPGYLLDYEPLLDVIKEELNKNPDSEYFLSWGFDYVKFATSQDRKKSYAEEIENVAPGVPVFLFDNSGHQALCNITALKMAGVYDNPTVRGGIIELNSDGVPSGIIRDDAVFYVLSKVIDLSKFDPEIIEKSCKNAIDELHRRGFTNYFDAYLNGFHDYIFYQYVKEMDDKNELNLNMGACYTIRSYDVNEYEEKINHVVEIADKYHTGHFNPYNIKLFADGVVEAQTGWIIGEYPNAEKGKEHGNIVWQKEELSNIVKFANSKNISVHTHSFGDEACKNMIDVYIDANNESGDKIRNTLGHVRNITDEDIKRCAENNIGIAENLVWHEGGDDDYAGLMHMLLPDGYFESGYPMKSLIDAGILVSSSTDAPAGEVIEGNIFNIIEVATTGIAPNYDNKPFNTSELLTVREALECLTINGAKQLGIDDKSGSIKIGKNADFLIIDTNFLDFEGDDLRKIHESKIKDVYFEGKKVR